MDLSAPKQLKLMPMVTSPFTLNTPIPPTAKDFMFAWTDKNPGILGVKWVRCTMKSHRGVMLQKMFLAGTLNFKNKVALF